MTSITSQIPFTVCKTLLKLNLKQVVLNFFYQRYFHVHGRRAKSSRAIRLQAEAPGI